MLRGGILIYIWDFPEVLSQAILVGIILVGRLGVVGCLLVICLIRRVGDVDCAASTMIAYMLSTTSNVLDVLRCCQVTTVS